MVEPARRAVKSEAVKRREAIADIIQTVQRIVRATYRFTRRGLKEHGAGGPQVWALRALSESPKMTVGQLAEGMYLHISTVSSLADQLVRHGWAERERSVEDRRVVWLQITQAGRDIIARSDVPPRARLPHGLEKLEPAELFRTQRAFLRVSQIMGLLEDPPEPEE